MGGMKFTTFDLGGHRQGKETVLKMYHCFCDLDSNGTMYFKKYFLCLNLKFYYTDFCVYFNQFWPIAKRNRSAAMESLLIV